MPAAPDKSARQTTTPWLTFAALAGGMIVFGSATPVSKLVTADLPVFIGATLRVAIGALALLPLVAREGLGWREISKRDYRLILLLALFGMVGFSAFMLYGMAMVSGVAGSIVMSTTPAVTAVAAFLFLRESFGWFKAGGAALAVLGVLALNLSGAGGSGSNGWTLAIGSLLVFAAVCCEVAYTLLGKLVTANVTPLRLSFLAAVFALPMFAVPAAVQAVGFDWGQVSLTGWLAVLWWGAGTMSLGSVLWYTGVSRAEGSVAAGFMGLMPLSALVLSYGLLGENFVWMHLLGFAIVFAGVLLVARAHAKSS
jgi:drug/metabolite transporter (DMT)-like permease